MNTLTKNREAGVVTAVPGFTLPANTKCGRGPDFGLINQPLCKHEPYAIHQGPKDRVSRSSFEKGSLIYPG